MNARRLFRYSCLSVILVLVALPVLAAPDMRGERMPRLKGESFAADLGAAKRGGVAIFNITEDRVSLYVFDAEKNVLDTLWSHAAVVTRNGDAWDVTIPDRNVTFSMKKGANGMLAFNGQESKLKAAPRGELDDVIVRAREACTKAPEAAKDPTTGQQAQDQLQWCIFAGYYGGCCDACYCTHRTLGIWEWVDSICCGFGC